MPHQKQNDDQHLDNSRDGPVRQCAATRERLAQSEMVRFALAPNGEVTPDLAAKLPGRGVWIKADRTALDLASAKGAFARGFKRQATAATDLSNLVERLLVKRLQGLLGMAKRAGTIVLGFDQVRADVRKRRPGFLLEAADGAEDGRNKVYFLAKGLYDEVRVAGALTSAELGMAFGRSHVVHGVLEAGALTDKWSVEYRRLAGFRQT
ncbi:MAG: RNA-binding protein, partial [Pseudomonadota bacterium]